MNYAALQNNYAMFSGNNSFKERLKPNVRARYCYQFALLDISNQNQDF
jgi:hypothetical protein